MRNVEVTTNDIMQFLEKNMVMREEFNCFKNNTETRLDNLEVRFSGLEGRVGHLENQMVTKDYLDNKFIDFAIKINQKIKECLCLT